MMNDVPPPFDAVWFLAMLGFIVGACLGSFATMLSYRLPRKLSIVTPPSQCPKCHSILKPADLVPIISWLTFGGKCSHCHAKISARYVWIELVTASLCAFTMAVIGFHPIALPAFAVITALVTTVTIIIEQNKHD